jgi:hypothetical protein
MGYGDLNFVSKGEVFLYKIRFENEANATAPAQKVIIKYKISEYLDPRSFKLQSWGYSNFSYDYSVPTCLSQLLLDFPTDPSMKIRFQAGLNVITNEIIWIIESVDVNTGQAPIDVGIGFLPPNNGTSGQGYVTFSLNVREDTVHMSQIDAQAEIIFDSNEPILTPEIFHTIDDAPPTIDLNINTQLMMMGQFGINLNKSDNGSGFGSLDLYEYDASEGKLVFIMNTQENVAILPFKEKRNYTITAIGKDLVGNRQDMSQLKSIDVSFDYTIGCPNECSANGLCTDNGVCKCDQNYILTDCSFYFDGNNTNTFVFRTTSSALNMNSTEWFRLNFNFASRYTFSDIRLTITGWPSGVNTSKGEIENGTIALVSFDSLDARLPNNFTDQIELQVKLEVKYLYLEFFEIDQITIRNPNKQTTTIVNSTIPRTTTPITTKEITTLESTATTFSRIPLTTYPRTATPRTTSLITTSPRTTSPRTTSPRTTSPRTTSPRTTSPRTTTSLITTSPRTTSPRTTSPRTTSPRTTSPRTTSPRTTTRRTTSPRTTSPRTTSPRTTSPRTTSPRTTSPRTTSPRTTSPRTTSPRTTSPRTTTPRTTSPRTTTPRTTTRRTTTRRTTSPRTTSPRTTSPRTTSPRTTSPRTTSPRTTSPRTTSPRNNQPKNNQPKNNQPKNNQL